MQTKLIVFVLFVGACASQSSAQPGFDSTGDGLLSGAYYMRQVVYFVNGQGALADTMNVQGTITFSGEGNYTFSGSLLDRTGNPTLVTYSTTGTYVISGSGEGFISAVNTDLPGDKIFGLVSHGVFIGSSTQTPFGYNDLVIAAPIGAQATNATLSGAYTVAYIDPTLPGDGVFNMTADGQGNIGTINVTGYLGTSATATDQTLNSVTYAFSNGAAQLKFGGAASSSTLVSGTQLLYISPDGNFIFGGSYQGYDMFVGVRAATTAPSNYDGLYYQAGLSIDESATASGSSVLNSYFGSFQAFSGNILGHLSMGSASPIKYQSVNSLRTYGGSSDFTYLDAYTLNSDGSSSDNAFAQHYASSTDGTIRIGYGIGPFLALNVAFQQPSFSGPGVFLNPAGVVNAASSAPFSAQLSEGEFLTLYGTGLAPSMASANVPFPPTLNGVQVLINQVPAPIYYVSPTQISVVVPYGIKAGAAAQIQVVNNNVSSNVVSQLTGSTSPGIFTNNPVGGIGYAAALHPDYSLISPTSPAHVGETVAVYMAGLGAVSPSVKDGTAASSKQLSYTIASPLVFLLDGSGNYKQATVAFSGLAPGYAGLYQLNFTIPAGLDSGDASIEVIGPDSDAFEALLPLASN